ncbi:Gfo/Idh/MocA family oxidoreductase [Frigoribacterium salinisoli]
MATAPRRYGGAMTTTVPFPSPGPLDLRAAPPLRWGVVGTGEIAGDFTDALHAHTAQRVVAVASRTTERAEAFGRAHGAELAFTDPHAMAAEVDVVYVATPHSRHHDDALAAITAGTPVLVEKPMGLSAAQTEAVAAAAREHGVLAAEAMWTRYLPQSRVLAALLEAGDLGTVRLADAAVGWQADLGAGGRMLDPALGGGALLDAGVYAFWFAQFAIGRPLSVDARGTMRPDGVDLEAAAVLTGAGGALATAATSLLTTTDGLASISGDRGVVRFTEHMVFPASFTLTRGGSTATWQDPTGLRGREGLAHEGAAIAALVAEGRTDSPVHGLDDSIALARTLDAVRDGLTVA